MTDKADPHPFGTLAEGAGPPRIILHVGAPKCGSSSVQATLSVRPDFTNEHGANLSYVCVSKRGVRVGNAIRMAAAASPYGYVSSSDATTDEDLTSLSGKIEGALRPILGSGRIPILSCEGWALRGRGFAKTGVWERLGGGVHVVLFVRPPLEWLNAGWWQWGAWTGATLDRYLQQAVQQVRWHRLAQDWADVPGVEAVHVRLAVPDAVAAFFALLEAPFPKAPKGNASLPPSLMAFLLRNRDLRPDVHSPAILFQLSRALTTATAPPPADPPLWCLRDDQMQDCWDRLRFHPRKLAPLLPPDDRARMRDDRHWFGPEPYAGRAVTDLEAFATSDRRSELLDWLSSVTGLRPDVGGGPSAEAVEAAIRAQVLRLVGGRPGPLGAVRNRLLNRPA